MCLFFKDNINTRFSNNIRGGKKSKLVCFGDSITWGYYFGIQSTRNYPASLEKKIKRHYKNAEISIVNEGHNGWTSRDAMKYVHKIAALKADTVIVMFGINDVLRELELDEYQNNMKYIINEIRKSGADVVLMSPTDINMKINSKLDIYAKKALRVAKNNGARIIDLRKIMRKISDLGGFERNYFLSIDTLHFKSDKYSTIADIIFRRIL